MDTFIAQKVDGVILNALRLQHGCWQGGVIPVEEMVSQTYSGKCIPFRDSRYKPSIDTCPKQPVLGRCSRFMSDPCKG
ncbi:MAG: hypothetical protein GXW96_12305 [Christensenellaceae bacterium]|nr:hypothetical protein [Christensenellaceae bacterium]